ncbi:MAG: hypothetical protein IT317_17030 [Anaerolineales bacterium]|nr:hypothetical protein [Anaerolineales bacterium]
MAQPEFDWTFEEAPAASEAPPAAGRPEPPRPGAGPPERRPPRLWRALRSWPRWARWALLGGLAALLLGGYGFVQLGWLRLQRQIAAEVAYDDARSRARAVDAVLAAQVSNDPYWRAQRRAEVELGLPAPLPAGSLALTSDPAWVVALRLEEPNIFAATVRRRYADSAGRVYDFDLQQRYQNLAPGAWTRLGADLRGLVAATSVQGAWLSATVPTNDLPWVRPALLAADEALLAACAAWESCPAGYRLSLAFNVGPEILNPSLPLRATEPFSAAYPLIFDLAASAPAYPERIVFSAPQITGRPADAAAQAAYNRALSAQLLGYMAAVISQSPRSRSDFLLDALVARMETRLGLSVTADPPLDPLNFVPAEAVWTHYQQALAGGGRAGLADRQRALALLNVVLVNQPPSVDGGLLRTVHRPYVAQLADWLAGSLWPGDVAHAAARWEAANRAALGPPAADWSSAEGLALSCAPGLALVERGRPRPIAPSFLPPEYSAASVIRAAGGRYLALTYTVLDPGSAGGRQPQVWLIDQTGELPPRSLGVNSLAVGWDAAGAFYYLAFSPDDPGLTSTLLRLDLPSGQATAIAQNVFAWADSWSADRRALVVIRFDSQAGAAAAPYLLTLTPEVSLEPLVALEPQRVVGRDPVFGPGSTSTAGQVAYIVSAAATTPAYTVRVLDLASGGEQVVFDSAAGLTRGLNAAGLLWSPGGAWLAWGDFGTDVFSILAAPAAGGPAREWRLPGPSDGDYPLAFSADDAFLAVQRSNGSAVGPVALLDLNAPAGGPARPLSGRSLAWAPTGHTFAFSNALGVFLVDAATGDYQWLQAEPCDLGWAP